MSVFPSPSYRGFNAEAGPSTYAAPAHHSLPAYPSSHYPSYAHCSDAHPRPSTSRSHSASSSQSSIVATNKDQKRVSRPLPRIPASSAPTTPLSSGPADRFSYPRPLPTPPLRAETPSPVPSCPSPVRPLPVPGSAYLHQNLSTSASLRPTLSLRVNTPGKTTTEILLDATTPLSPMCASPLSPVVFSTQDSPTVEEHVANRLSTLGFVEVDSDQPRQSTDSQATLAPLERVDSVEGVQREDVEIRVELVSDVSERRTSRLWIFEKKGKRRIEHNYNEILRQLRKL